MANRLTDAFGINYSMFPELDALLNQVNQMKGPSGQLSPMENFIATAHPAVTGNIQQEPPAQMDLAYSLAMSGSPAAADLGWKMMQQRLQPVKQDIPEKLKLAQAAMENPALRELLFPQQAQKFTSIGEGYVMDQQGNVKRAYTPYRAPAGQRDSADWAISGGYKYNKRTGEVVPLGVGGADGPQAVVSAGIEGLPATPPSGAFNMLYTLAPDAVGTYQQFTGGENVKDFTSRVKTINSQMGQKAVSAAKAAGQSGINTVSELRLAYGAVPQIDLSSETAYYNSLQRVNDYFASIQAGSAMPAGGAPQGGSNRVKMVWGQ